LQKQRQKFVKKIDKKLSKKVFTKRKQLFWAISPSFVSCFLPCFSPDIAQNRPDLWPVQL
jgi:hypothetical protein